MTFPELHNTWEWARKREEGRFRGRRRPLPAGFRPVANMSEALAALQERRRMRGMADAG